MRESLECYPCILGITVERRHFKQPLNMLQLYLSPYLVWAPARFFITTEVHCLVCWGISTVSLIGNMCALGGIAGLSVCRRIQLSANLKKSFCQALHDTMGNGLSLICECKLPWLNPAVRERFWLWFSLTERIQLSSQLTIVISARSVEMEQREGAFHIMGTVTQKQGIVLAQRVCK